MLQLSLQSPEGNLSLKTMVDVVKLENSDGDSAQVHLHGKLTEYE